MKFTEAFKLMKQGVPVKLPSWAGYWCWDEEKQTIMMHCRPQSADDAGAILDIRDTDRVEYTMANILSDEWIIADKSITPILGGEATFGFNDAIRYLKRGMKVARKGWNGKGMYVFLVKGIELQNVIRYNHADVEEKPCADVLALKATTTIQVGWLASQTDMLAEDWMFVE